MSDEDKIAIEFLEASGGRWDSALHRMAHTISMARCRAEDSLPNKSMSGEQLRLLWQDLHPNRPRPTPPAGEDG